MGENGAHDITRLFNAPCRMATMKTAPGKVRIIGGQWRGTRLDVPDVVGLRPTSDRARETLFNWLQPMLPGAHVLDLFAGSGALGLEAVSRGAAGALLVERDAVLARSLTATAARLPGGAVVEVRQGDALRVLAGVHATLFDVAFVDPPFADALWPAVFAALPGALRPDAWLYVESRADQPALPGPEWRPHRELRMRDLHNALYRRAG